VSQGSALGSYSNEISDQLELAGYHSLSQDVLHGCRIINGSGLIGWVSKNNKAIHVSPFDRDSRTLGIYTQDQQLKSFIGVPVSFAAEGSTLSVSGVIACDSRKSFAFSKLQGKLIEDLSLEVSSTIKLHLKQVKGRSADGSWHDFLRDTIKLAESLGRDSLEILRVKIMNFDELEDELGTADYIKLTQQLARLIKQALPPHFPSLTLPNGDIVVALDVMASSFYENRINAVCSHISSASKPPKLVFSRRALRDKRYRNATIERLVATTAQFEASSHSRQGEFLYEYRRA